MPPSPYLTVALKLFALPAITNGVLDILGGVSKIERMTSSSYTAVTDADILADGMLRFMGGVFLSYGSFQWWCSNDIRNRRTPLAILGLSMFFGGIGRWMGAIKYKKYPAGEEWAIAMELIGPVVFWRAVERWG